MKKKLPILICFFVLSLLPFQILAHQFYNLKSASVGFLTSEIYQENKEFIISPNPANSTINLYLPKGFENAKLSVFDVLGKEIYNIELNSLHSTINITKWNSGVYLVRIATDTDSQT